MLLRLSRQFAWPSAGSCGCGGAVPDDTHDWRDASGRRPKRGGAMLVVAQAVPMAHAAVEAQVLAVV
jgi:hypothetical protein